MAKPDELGRAFMKFIYKQSRNSVKQLIEVSYRNGLFDAREICLRIVQGSGGERTAELLERIRTELPESKPKRKM